MKTSPLILLLLVLPCISLQAKEPARVLDPIEKSAKHPKGVDLKLMSTDKTYGYSDQNAIKVGSKEEFGGPGAEREYLSSLLDSKGKPITFKRLASGGNSPDGKPLDIYEVTLSDGSKVILWLNMYYPKNKPAKQPAPVGFYKKKS
ncbi:hypothetical protein NT6N_07870 [Oceaniferula spumae]|uniref:DUF1942 domain-containing protein n=1 Tax=Oceaniferula spumae TaxID=2979115 RepID=A0AAT9FIH5_9BACT